MKARDPMLPVRRGILTLLKANAELTALVPAGRHYPQSPPAQPSWPFLRYGTPSVTPIRGVCASGGDVLTAVHGFSKGVMTGARITESAEDHAARIGAAIVKALDCGVIDLEPGRGRVLWDGSQLLQDPEEAGAYHVLVNLRVRAIS